MRRLYRFWDELRRRRVIQAVIAYIVLALGILEASDIITQALELSSAGVQWTLWTLVVGFPVACVASWRWDLTAEGFARTESNDRLLDQLKQSPAISIAVLPFDDHSKRGDQAYFADGIADEITTALTSVPRLGVSSRTSAFAMRNVKDPREAARELDVDALLMGTVRKVGDEVHISTQLVDGPSGARLWSQEYAREMADVIDIQEDIARQVVSQLESALGSDTAAPRMRSHSPDPRAYELYLEARYSWTRRHEVGLERSIECYQRAIDVDPTYALAHAGVADVHMFKGFYLIEEPAVAWEKARVSIDRALASESAPAEAHRARGMMLTWYDWDFEGAEASFGRALDLDPSDPTAPLMYGQLLAATGRRDEARALAERGRMLDPTSAATVGLTAVAYAINRDGQRAADLTEGVLTREPVNFLNRYIAGTAYLGTGDLSAAIENLELAVDISRRNPLIVSFLAQAYARVGQTSEARDVLASLNPIPVEHYPFAGRAAAHCALGEMDTVDDDMNRAIERHEPILFISGSAPVFDPLRLHPNYAEWMKRIGLPLLSVQVANTGSEK